MAWTYPIIEGLLQLAPLAALFLLRPRNARFFLLFCLLFLLDKALTVYLLGLSPGRWNWAGKAASLAWGVAFASSNPWLTREEMGWRAWPREGSRRFVALAVLGVLSLRLGADLWFRGRRAGCTAETLWYQATMPGLAEEVAYRGVFRPLLGRCFPGRALGMSYGLLLSSLLFGLLHGLTFDGEVHFSPQRLAMTAALGLVLGLVAEKGGSLLPAIVLHNLWNLIVFRP